MFCFFYYPVRTTLTTGSYDLDCFFFIHWFVRPTRRSVFCYSPGSYDLDRTCVFFYSLVRTTLTGLCFFYSGSYDLDRFYLFTFGAAHVYVYIYTISSFHLCVRSLFQYFHLFIRSLFQNFHLFIFSSGRCYIISSFHFSSFHLSN